MAPQISAPLPDAEDRSASSLEMQLGSVWLVRIGIVLLLTGLVFLANYAYQNFIGRLGPAGKVTLLYLFSGGLVTTGAWLQRKREELRTYGQVVLAGGMAGVYFTTYAAHHFPLLQVIPSAFLDGILLLGWTGVMAWVSDRKQSQSMALLAFVLAYYTSGIGHLGPLTLFSSLILASGAVWLLARRRWLKVAYVSLIATYLGYGFSRFYLPEGSSTFAATGVWQNFSFLGGYWCIYTAAVFFVKPGIMTATHRTALASANNAAAFALAAAHTPIQDSLSFAMLSLSFGLILLAGYAAARTFLPREGQLQSAYLAQGLSLTTLGVLTHFTGRTLALLLGFESVLLLLLSPILQNQWLRRGAYPVAALAVLHTLSELSSEDQLSGTIGFLVAILMGINARLEERRSDSSQVFDFGVSWFSILGLVTLGTATWTVVPTDWRSSALALEALLFALTALILKVRALTLLAQALLLLGSLTLLPQSGFEVRQLQNLTIVAIAIFLSQWWSRPALQETFGSVSVRICQHLFAWTAVGTLYLWLLARYKPAAQIIALPTVCFAIALGATWFRSVPLAIASQFLLLAGTLTFLHSQPWTQTTTGFGSLLLIAITGTIGWLGKRWILPRLTNGAQRDQLIDVLPPIYGGATWILSLVWVLSYLDFNLAVPVLAMAGAGLFMVGQLRQNVKPVLLGIGYQAVALGLLWYGLNDLEKLAWGNWIALLIPIVQQHLLHRKKPAWDEEPAQRVATALAVLSLAGIWNLTSLATQLVLSPGYLTIAWGLLALVIFSLAVICQSTLFRRCGLFILAIALARAIVIDVWKLESFYRIISFMGLGAVLLILGYIYNRFSSKLKQWL